MKNALIINGGNNTTERDQIGEFDFVVAVDSGAEHAYKLFLKPDDEIKSKDLYSKSFVISVTKLFVFVRSLLPDEYKFSIPLISSKSKLLVKL